MLGWFKKKAKVNHEEQQSIYDIELARLRALPLPTTTTGMDEALQTLKALYFKYDDYLTTKQRYDSIDAADELQVAVQSCTSVGDLAALTKGGA